MDNGQKEETISSFPQRWLAIMLTQCRAVGGLLHFLREGAGLHPRYTNIDNKKSFLLNHFLRIEINKGMFQDYTKFMDEWNTLGELIYKFANEHGDEFNKLHKRTKR